LDKIGSRLIGKALEEAKQLVWIVLYLWVLIGLFTVFKSLVLKDHNLFYHQGFAIINALVLAKVVLVADLLQVAENLKDKPLVYPIVFKSVVFCAILMGFYIGEETLIGVWHGKAIVESFPDIGGGTREGVFVVGLILFIGLIPFFAYRELARVLGADEVYALVFSRGTEGGATPRGPRRGPAANSNAPEIRG
jgi:hypothetical protein